MRLERLIGAWALCATAACGAGQSNMSFAVSGDMIIADGEVDAAALDSFVTLIERHPNVTTLMLRYVGGSLDDEANLALGRIVRDRGLSTVVPADGLVASGGTDLFLAGTQRILQDGACVGVHAWSDDRGVTANDIPRSSAAHAPYLRYYAQLGVAPAFYWFTLQAAPAEGMHWMSGAEAQRFGMAHTRAPALSEAEICDRR